MVEGERGRKENYEREEMMTIRRAPEKARKEYERREECRRTKGKIRGQK